MTTPVHRLLALFIVLLVLASSAAAQETAAQAVGEDVIASPLTFSVTYDDSITDSYTGRVYVMLSGNVTDEPRRGPSWFNTQPFYAVDVENWTPGEELRFDSSDTTLAYPAPLRELPAGDYAVQAVMRRNLDSPEIGTGAGTAYSSKIEQKLDGGSTGNVSLHITELVPNEDPTQHPRIKDMIDNGRLEHLRVRSDLLSTFHGRDIYLEATALLPDGYHDPENAQRRYPALYMISGFGGDEFQALYMAFMGRGDAADDIIKIGLDPLMRTGHNVFANSANNGPCGDALVEELIPHLEKSLRLTAAPHGRYLTGISSGGWSSLWLQIQYPSFFGGVWSFVPDPVDFRKFQTVNIFKDGANMYVDETGSPRPLGRRNGEVIIWTEDFAKMEHVMGEGGQLHSFEAVFSPKGADGKPMPLYDRDTGAIDPAVAEAWKKYDIRLYIEEHWPRIGEALQGKLHIIAGEDDNFYLEDAVKLLEKALNWVGSDAQIEVVEGRDHGTTPTPDRFQNLDQQLLEMYNAGETGGAT